MLDVSVRGDLEGGELTLQDPQEQELQEPEQQLQELSKLVSLNSSKM